MAHTVVVASQAIVQAVPSRTVRVAGGVAYTDEGTQYAIVGTVDGAGPLTVYIWTEVYTQTQAAGYVGPTWAEIVAAALVVAADPPSQDLGGASLVGQAI